LLLGQKTHWSKESTIFLEWHALNHIPVIGPSKLGAQLEGSKEFAKEFLVTQYLTAAYDSFSRNSGRRLFFLETLQPPFVLKQMD
jgi:phosphoribosylamine--glycine ligase